MSEHPGTPEAIEPAKVEFERMLKRNIRGLDYFSSPAPVVGVSQKDVLINRGTMQLLHYRPLVEEVYRVPVLIVMANTNRGYIFDMRPGQSFVEYLLKAGYDVFMLDWNPPRSDDRNVGLDDYVLDFIPSATDRIRQETGETDVSVIGYCMGGVLTLIWAALHPDGPAKNVLTFTTPVDMSEMKQFHTWADKRYFDVDRLVETFGNCPSEVIYGAFDMLRPAEKTASKARLWDNLWDDEYVKSFRMFDRWAVDILPFPGRYFQDLVKGLMWNNGFITKTLEVQGRPVDLANIKVPFFMATAEHDSVVPPNAGRPLFDLVGSTDKHHEHLRGGHVSVITGPNAVKRLWPAVDNWLRERST